MKKHIAQGYHILVEYKEATEHRTDGGIILSSPVTTEQKWLRGTVLSIGGKAKDELPDLTVGCTVVFDKFSGANLEKFQLSGSSEFTTIKAVPWNCVYSVETPDTDE